MLDNTKVIFYNIVVIVVFFFTYSTTEVLKYQATLPSNKAVLLSADMRQRFAEVGEEKALDLHDALEANERSVSRSRSLAIEKFKTFITSIVVNLFEYLGFFSHSITDQRNICNCSPQNLY